MLTAPPHVHAIDDLCDILIVKGFVCVDDSPDMLRCTASSDVDRAALFEQLRAAGFAWSRGREWSPAEVFEWLRDQNLLSGTFTSISWKSPDEWVLRDE